MGFDRHVLSKGPTSSPQAWAEKLRWCKKHIPNITSITITQNDKGLTYGDVLVDDWPEYIRSWLKRNPSGQVIMPAQRWNEKFKHTNVFRYTGADQLSEVRKRFMAIKINA